MVSKEVFPEVGRRIKQLRESRNIEQLELAELMGYKSQSTISKWESGTNLPNGGKLVKLAKALNTTTDNILFGSEIEQKEETIDLKETPAKRVAFDGREFDEDDMNFMNSVMESYFKNKYKD